MSRFNTYFQYDIGAVRIEVYDMPAGGLDPVRGNLVVKRAISSNDPAQPDTGPWTLEPLRGYGVGWVGAGNTSAGPIYDWDMPIGGPDIKYFLVPESQKSAGAADKPNVPVHIPGNLAYLRDIYSPAQALTLPVQVVSVDPETKTARQTTYAVVGREKPIVVWDLRLARSGVIQLRIENLSTDLYRNSYREKMDALLASGRPLLFSMCYTKGFPPAWLAISDAVYTRILDKNVWTLDLTYQQVDSPLGYNVSAPVELSYAAAAAIPAVGALYSDWWTSTTGPNLYDDYFDLAGNRQNP